MEKRHTSIRLPIDVIEKLRELARQEDRSMASMIEQLIKRAYDEKVDTCKKVSKPIAQNDTL